MKHPAAPLLSLFLTGMGSLHAAAPAAVTGYWKTVETAVKHAHPAANSSVVFAFKPTFWRTAAGFDGHRHAWLVGADVARDKRFECSVFAIIDKDGTELFNPGSASLAQEGFPLRICGVDDALLVRIAPGEQVLATTSRGDPRFSSDTLDLHAVLPKGKLLPLLREHGSPSAGDSAATWESAYYFTDFDHDGRTDILINRRLRTYTEAGVANYRNQKLILKLEPKTLQVRNVTMENASNLVKIFTAAKRDATIPVIFQYGPVTSIPGEFGEAIYPGEDEWCKFRYAEVLPPDLPGDVFVPAKPVDDPGK